MKKIYIFLLLLFLVSSLLLAKFIFSRDSGADRQVITQKTSEPETKEKSLEEAPKGLPVKISEPSPPVLSTSLLNPPQEQKGVAPSPESLAAPAKDPPDGTYKTYYPHGVPQAIFQIKGGQLDGVRKIFAEDGTIIREERYDEGRLQGVSKVYYESGALKAEIHFVNNQREGVSRVFAPTGALWAEEIYKNNKLNGITKSYYPGRQLMFEVTFQDGVPLTRKQFYPSGGVLREDHFENSKLTGISKFYSETGKMIAEVTYQEDAAISLKKYDAGGKVVLEITEKDKIPAGDALFKLIQAPAASAKPVSSPG